MVITCNNTMRISWVVNAVKLYLAGHAKVGMRPDLSCYRELYGFAVSHVYHHVLPMAQRDRKKWTTDCICYGLIWENLDMIGESVWVNSTQLHTDSCKSIPAGFVSHSSYSRIHLKSNTYSSYNATCRGRWIVEISGSGRQVLQFQSIMWCPRPVSPGIMEDSLTEPACNKTSKTSKPLSALISAIALSQISCCHSMVQSGPQITKLVYEFISKCVSYQYFDYGLWCIYIYIYIHIHIRQVLHPPTNITGRAPPYGLLISQICPSCGLCGTSPQPPKQSNNHK